MNKLLILGIRGVPARHGGFETFAERLSVFLVERGWDVTVYCQEEGVGRQWESEWCGVKRIHVPVRHPGSFGSLIFDWKVTVDSISKDGILLTLGYNTAVLGLLPRMLGRTNIINMDGIEWRRAKWGAVAKFWFWINERVGSVVGNHLIADHPQIKEHLARHTAREKISTIPYGADEVANADLALLDRFDVSPDRFSIVIARPEPENSFLELVRAFSRAKRNHKLIVVGGFTPKINSYHREVIASASDEVVFPGAIYDGPTVGALRRFCRLYLHGHTVGGTNPSLVEALGAGCAVLAHDNPFNRWVAGNGGIYFKGEDECAIQFDRLLRAEYDVSVLRTNSYARFKERFTWPRVLHEYENLLSLWYPK